MSGVPQDRPQSAEAARRRTGVERRHRPEAGTVEGYNYSKANKSSGITWTEDVFTAYIKNPRKYIKGTRMSFAGLKDEKDIKDLIAYLKTFKADGTEVN